MVGSDGMSAYVYSVDSRGTVSNMGDVGFAAIGIGAWHAKSRLMQSGYTNALSYVPALSAVFAAKKSAEIAPGVGTATDIHLVFRNSIERLDEAVAAKAAELYQQYSDQQKANGAHYVELLRQFVATQKPKAAAKADHSDDAKIDEHPSANVPEVTRGHEDGEEKSQAENGVA